MPFFTAWATQNPTSGSDIGAGASKLLTFNTDYLISTTLASQSGHSTWSQFEQTNPQGGVGLAKIKATIAAVRAVIGASQI